MREAGQIDLLDLQKQEKRSRPDRTEKNIVCIAGSMPPTKKSRNGMMRVGQLCEMFAELAYPQEGQAVLANAGRARQGGVLLTAAVIGVAISI